MIYIYVYKPFSHSLLTILLSEVILAPSVCQVKRLILIQKKKNYKTPRIVTLGAALAVSPFTGEDFHR